MIKIDNIIGTHTLDLDTGIITDTSLIDCFGGGKSGGYSGPSAAEIQMQKDMYRQEWEAEQEVEEIEEIEEEIKVEEEEAKEEIESRRGVKDVLSNSQIGFTKKLKNDKGLGDIGDIGAL